MFHYTELTSYRPHSKDEGRLYFHFVCQSTSWLGGTPSGPLRGYPRQVLTRGVPHPVPIRGGYPHPSWQGGTPILSNGGGMSGLDGGTPLRYWKGVRPLHLCKRTFLFRMCDQLRSTVIRNLTKVEENDTLSDYALQAQRLMNLRWCPYLHSLRNIFFVN